MLPRASGPHQYGSLAAVGRHVAEGATLLFGPEAADYQPVVPTRWEGTELYGYSPLIYANDVHDVAITGKGVIDGNAGHEFHTWYDKQAADQQCLRQMGFTGVPLAERVFGAGTFLRPSAIQFFHAERVLLEDYTVHNSPFWINHLVYTDHRARLERGQPPAARSPGRASTSWCVATTWAARTASRWAARCRATSGTCTSPTTYCVTARRRSASRATSTAAARWNTSVSGT